MTSAKIECVDCAKLPHKPTDMAFGEDALYDGFRPKPLRKIDPRSLESHKTQPRCREHWLAWRNARRARTRTGHKAKTYGVSREIQAVLWEYQGSSCPCGRKAAKEIPAGVSLHHNRELAARHDHPDDKGCIDCVEGFLCASCNRDIIGRLERTYRDYVLVVAALTRIRDQIADPPLRRLLAERPDLLEMAS